MSSDPGFIFWGLFGLLLLLLIGYGFWLWGKEHPGGKTGEDD